VFNKAFFVITSTLLFGCNTAFLGGYGEENQTLSAFAERVETVFKFQNSMTNAVMLLDTEPSEIILNAERKMHTACQPLNEYAAREMDNLNVDFSLQKRVENTAISCEKAANQLQILLKNNDNLKGEFP
jgi:hypothetical protein